MKKLNRSTFFHKDVFSECIKTSVKYKDEYNKCLDILEQPEKKYLELAENCSLHSYSEDWPEFRKDLMVTLYDNKLVKLGSVARKTYYDEIMRLAQNGICPICEHLKADSLDHFLPKSEFPSLAVVPLNLYPCCTICNEEKDAFHAIVEDEQLFNPYFEAIENIEWLEAELIPDNEIVIKYSVKGHLDKKIIKRLENYLKVYGLKTLYASESVIYFNNNLFTYKTSFEVEGRIGLEREIDKALTSSKVYNLNSWTKVLLEALKKSDWFLDGNFIAAYAK